MVDIVGLLPNGVSVEGSDPAFRARVAAGGWGPPEPGLGGGARGPEAELHLESHAEDGVEHFGGVGTDGGEVGHREGVEET